MPRCIQYIWRRVWIRNVKSLTWVYWEDDSTVSCQLSALKLVVYTSFLKSGNKRCGLHFSFQWHTERLYWEVIWRHHVLGMKESGLPTHASLCRIKLFGYTQCGAGTGSCNRDFRDLKVDNGYLAEATSAKLVVIYLVRQITIDILHSTTRGNNKIFLSFKQMKSWLTERKISFFFFSLNGFGSFI